MRTMRDCCIERENGCTDAPRAPGHCIIFVLLFNALSKIDQQHQSNFHSSAEMIRFNFWVFTPDTTERLYNLNQYIVDTPSRCQRLACKDSLFALYDCRLQDKTADLWSHNNYIVYVLEGRKIWHTAHGSFDLRRGDCVFVRKGACILEQFFDAEFCFYLFFVSDEFICDVLRTKSTPLSKSPTKFNPLIPINNCERVRSFFQSMLPYFNSEQAPDQTLLELKFKELILLLADCGSNENVSHFSRAFRSQFGTAPSSVKNSRLSLSQ